MPPTRAKPAPPAPQPKKPAARPAPKAAPKAVAGVAVQLKTARSELKNYKTSADANTRLMNDMARRIKKLSSDVERLRTELDIQKLRVRANEDENKRLRQDLHLQKIPDY